MDDKHRAIFGAIASALAKIGADEAEIQAIRDQLGAPGQHTDTPNPAPTIVASYDDTDIKARLSALERAPTPTPYDDGPLAARVTTLETEVEEINEGLDQLASAIPADLVPVGPTASVPVATVTTDPGTGATVIVTTNPADGTTLATPVDQVPTTGTVVINATTGEPGIDPDLVKGAVDATVTGDMAPAHPDIPAPADVVAADPSANVAAQPTS